MCEQRKVNEAFPMLGRVARNAGLAQVAAAVGHSAAKFKCVQVRVEDCFDYHSVVQWVDGSYLVPDVACKLAASFRDDL